MATFVLIAGAWHGSWCWSEVAPLLERAGHRVLAPDLLDADNDGAPPPEQPLAAWADRIAGLLRSERDPVVLVGHSRGGLVISEVAERVPEKVGLLVYLAAFLLRDGQTLREVAGRADNAAAMAGAVSLDGGMLRFGDEGVRRLLYNRTPERLVELARGRLAPEPAAAFATPVRVTDGRFGTVPRAYIECADDLALPLAEQRAMWAALPCAATRTLDSDHSPFFSMPAELALALEGCLADGWASRPQG